MEVLAYRFLHTLRNDTCPMDRIRASAGSLAIRTWSFINLVYSIDIYFGRQMGSRFEDFGDSCLSCCSDDIGLRHYEPGYRYRTSSAPVSEQLALGACDICVACIRRLCLYRGGCSLIYNKAYGAAFHW